MKFYLTLILCFFSKIAFSQAGQAGSPIEPKGIDVFGNVGKGDPGSSSSGNSGSGGGRGGKSGGKSGSSSKSPKASKAPGVTTVSPTLILELEEILVTYDYLDNPIISIVDKNALIHKLQLLEGKAGIDKRRADKIHIRSIIDKVQRGIGVQKADVSSPQIDRVSFEINKPSITHNINVTLAQGTFPGLKFIVPGKITNASGLVGEVLLRFYFPDGQVLKANPQETHYKDLDNSVVSGSGLFIFNSDNLKLEDRVFVIPYHALNLQPTGYQKTYNIKANVSVYINSVEIKISEFYPISFKF